MATKEEIIAAASKKFARKEIPIAPNVSVVVRELSRSEREALNKRLFVTGEDGKPLLFNAQGIADPKGDDYHYNEGVNYVNEWLAACLDPAFTVEEVAGAFPFQSFKMSLFNETQAINGIDVKTAAGN